MAASLMCRGVGKCGSPAPKSTRSTPWARSLAASAATAMVAETSIRPIRSAKTLVGLNAVVMLSIFTDFCPAANPCRIAEREKSLRAGGRVRARTFKASVFVGASAPGVAGRQTGAGRSGLQPRPPTKQNQDGLYRLRKNSPRPGFESGHDFSRAASTAKSTSASAPVQCHMQRFVSASPFFRSLFSP